VCELNIDDILEIKKIGFSKVSVFFKFRDAANALVDDRRLAAKGLEAFIPPFRTSRKGIIRDVPLDLTDHLILQHTTSPIKVVAVNRLNRRVNTTHQLNSQTDTSAPANYSPSYSVSLTFEGQKIPKYVYMYHVRYSVSPYIARVSRCNNCFRFGHIKANCKSQPRCSHCGEKGHAFTEEHCQQAQKPPKCANCRGEHRADSSLCPELALQKEIRKYAALRNISLLDAREIFKGNKTPPPFSSSSEEFPPISSTQYTQFTVSPPYTSSHSFHPISYPTSPPFSYAQAAKALSSSNLKSKSFSSPSLAQNIKSKSRSASLPQLTRLDKNPYLNLNLYHPTPPIKPSISNVSFSPSPSLHPSPPLNPVATPNPPLNPATYQDALNLITSFIIELSPLLASLNISELIPAVTQLIRNLSVNSSNISSASTKDD